MSRLCATTLALLVLGLPAAGAVALAARGTKESKAGAQPAGKAVETSFVTQPPHSMAEQFTQIVAEYKKQQDAVAQAMGQANDRREINKIYATMAPNELAFSRRMIDLAASSPSDPVARDALAWVINKPNMFDEGPYGDEFGRAAALLVRHHGDDPEAVRVGLGLNNITSFHRDALFLGFYAAAKGREAKGLARLALAQYLEQKSRFAAGLRQSKGRQKKVFFGVVDDNGKTVNKETELSDEEYAYQIHLRQCDPLTLQAESERLYSEVIADYGDIRHRSPKHRELEAMLKDPRATWAGKLLTDDDRRKIKEHLASARTLRHTAEARLDDMLNLVPGKPAPEIDGVDSSGKPLRLSSYRGKVVVLVFWGTWCGPCMRELPHERELAERLKDKPFALLGVNCDEDKKAALDAITTEKIAWPNWYDGAPGTGPIAKRYHIRSYPTVYVIDEKGIIRQKQVVGTALDQVVDELIKSMGRKEPHATPGGR